MYKKDFFFSICFSLFSELTKYLFSFNKKKKKNKIHKESSKIICFFSSSDPFSMGTTDSTTVYGRPR